MGTGEMMVRSHLISRTDSKLGRLQIPCNELQRHDAGREGK